MADRDYYDVLGVKRSATQDEIRAAYRKLARELHPDVNKAADAAEKFAEVQTAYDVLGEPDKRAQYDRFGRAGAAAAAGAGAGGAHYSWSNVGGRGGTGSSDFDLDDLGSMFDAFFGGGGGGAGPTPRNARAQRGRARERTRQAAQAELDVSFMTMARGGTERVPVRRGGKATTIEVSIPKAIADGAKLRVAGGRGEPDLILTIRVGKHPLYKREGVLDLAIDLPLTYAEAALGKEVGVPTLEGEVFITVPAGTRSGKRLRLRGRGLTDAKGASGDLFAVVQIVPPEAEALSDTDRAGLERLGEHTPTVRPSPPWPEPQG
ncbi:MAG: DnaJ domain-containing protein [Phycisphaerales bacterium]|jgi:DnaJ-class molecular chaperone